MNLKKGPNNDFNGDFSLLQNSILKGNQILFDHHIKSFNYFIRGRIQQIIEAKVNNTIQSDTKPGFFIQYQKIWLDKPSIVENFQSRKLTPQECWIRNLTYQGNVMVNISISYKEQSQHLKQEIKDLVIGKIPIMIGSDFCWTSSLQESEVIKLGECPLDPKGYFIINGIEKIILMQEQLCRNKILVEFDNKLSLLTSSCASSTLETKSKINIFIKGGVIYLKSSSFKELVPMSIIFKALGVQSDWAFCELINPFFNDQERSAKGNQLEGILLLTLEDSMNNKIYTRQTAKIHLSQKIKFMFKEQSQMSVEQKLKELDNILNKIILPHIEVIDNCVIQKIDFLALMTKKLLWEYLQLEKKDQGEIDVRNDRDFLANKRVECAGDMLSLLFEDLFKRFNSEVKKELDKFLIKVKQIEDLQKNLSQAFWMMVQSGLITNGMTHSIQSGNWSIKRFKLERKGVTQVMTRINYFGALGLLTKLESHIEKSRKVSGPRSLQCSHWGFICPVDTPDGENCGLVKNLTLLTQITTEIPSQDILLQLCRIGLIELGFFRLQDMNRDANKWGVMLNGQLVGGCQNHSRFIDMFKKLRKLGHIHYSVSIFENQLDKLIEIWSDGGRMIRPLINRVEFEKNIKVFQWIINELRHKQEQKSCIMSLIEELKSYNIIEFLDVNEMNNSHLVFNYQEIKENTTHLEFGLNIILGILAGIIPYPHHNQSPRNTYQCAMGKQSLGVSSQNHLLRFDTVSYQLIYPQKPLVTTNTLELVNFNLLPSGQNATIVIMSFSGYDIEDAIIMSKSSIQKGFGRAIQSKKEVVTFERGLESEGEILIPINESEGICSVGQRVKLGDILVNKYQTVGTAQAEPKQVRHKSKQSASVQQIFITSAQDNYLMVKMQINQLKVPEIGDKFSSRHGQKGVVGITIAQQDLPFNEKGITPDIIMNPHGFPSRMTIAKLLEILASKVGAISGKNIRANAFEDKVLCDQCQQKCSCPNVAKSLGQALKLLGYNQSGLETFYSGSSGQLLEGRVFCGPVYYQRLKHMVSEKMHARATGKKRFLTRQPLEGRAKEGGLRLGEMERDCLLAYGASEILKEWFLHSSDEYQCPICTSCKSIQCLGRCSGSNASVKYITMPYPTKLLLQELMSMNIMPKISIE